MPDRNWRIVLVFGLTFLIGTLTLIAFAKFNSYQVENRNSRDDDAEAKAADAHDQAKAHCIAVPSRTVAECEDEANEAADKARQPNRDLKAQQDMADWAYAMWWTTLVGTALSAAGVVLVYLNLRAVQEDIDKARDEAKIADSRFQQQLDKMDAANSTARDIGQKQTRAYLAIHQARIQFVWISARGKSTANLQILVRVQNSGQSPTRGLKMHIVAEVRSRSDATVLARIPSEDHFTESYIEIGAQSPDGLEAFIPYQVDKLGLDEGLSLTDAIRLQRVSLVVVVWVSGNDVFGDPLEVAYRGYTFHPANCQINTWYDLERVTGRPIA